MQILRGIPGPTSVRVYEDTHIECRRDFQYRVTMVTTRLFIRKRLSTRSHARMLDNLFSCRSYMKKARVPSKVPGPNSATSDKPGGLQKCHFAHIIQVISVHLAMNVTKFFVAPTEDSALTFARLEPEDSSPSSTWKVQSTCFAPHLLGVTTLPAFPRPSD